MCCEPEYTCEGWTERWRRARKAHRCCACRETIRPGDNYKYTSAIDPEAGGPVSWKHCARCRMVIDALLAKGMDGVDIELDCDNPPLPPEDGASRFAFLTRDEAQAILRAAAEREG